MEIDTLHQALLQSLNNKEYIIIEWASGLVIKAKVDTTYETDNGLEIDDEGYQEYYACAVEIITIISSPEDIDTQIKKGNLMEVSIRNKPLKVLLENNTMIWPR